MIELKLKEQVSSLLDNPFIVSLIRDKKYEIDNKNYIELEGELNFSLSFQNDKLVLTFHDLKPRITATRTFFNIRFQSRVNSLVFSKDNVVIYLSDFPAQTIPLI